MLMRIVMACGAVALIEAGVLGQTPDLTACSVDSLVSLTAPDAPSYCYFGSAVALRDGLAVVGALGDSSAGSDFGAAYVYRFDGGDWQFEAKLTPGGTSSTDRFGAAVAVAGPLLVVGQPRADLVAANSGAAYVFRQENGAWVQVQQITAPDARPDASFGMAIAASPEHVAIAAPRDDAGGDCAGAVYLYRVEGAELVFEQRVSAPPGTYQYFGEALGMENGLLVIGSPGETADTRYGAAHVLEYDGAQWNEVARLEASDPEPGMWFGGALSMQGDLVVVGAPNDDSSCVDPYGFACGSAYVFRSTGSEWIQETRLVNPLSESNRGFGSTVALAGDDILVSCGVQVFVFEQVGGEWVEQQTVTASNGAALNSAIAADGDVALAGGSSSEAGRSAGAAFVFRATGGLWAEEQKFLPDGSVAHAALGSAVAIAGVTAVAGVPFDDGAAVDAGAAYLYAFDGRNWVADTKLVAPDAEPGDQFGAAVALGAGLILVGAPQEDETDQDAGAVYVYAFDGADWAFETKITLSGDAPQAHFGAALALSEDVAVGHRGAGVRPGARHGIRLSPRPHRLDRGNATAHERERGWRPVRVRR